MTKPFWCCNCERELEDGDIIQNSPSDPENCECKFCGAYAGPDGAVVPIEYAEDCGYEEPSPQDKEADTLAKNRAAIDKIMGW